MKKVLFLILAVSLLFGCGAVQINPSTDADVYKMLGRDVGAYMMATKPDVVKRSAPWVAGALLLSDEEILNGDILQTVYEHLLREMPDNPEIVLLAKSTLNILGVKINMNASELLPEEKSGYIACVRGLLTGYSEATK